MRIPAESLFLIQAITLVGCPFLLWRLRWVRLAVPLVVLQIVLGIMLGPSVFGRVAPATFHMIFPASSLASLSGLAWLGLALFGFLSGLHFDLKMIRKRSWVFTGCAISTLVVPLLLGLGLALLFYRAPYTDGSVPRLMFAGGIAIAIAVTALPVLSAILLELRLISTPLGERVLGYAAFNDIMLWTALAGLSAGMASGATGSKNLALMIGLALAFVLLMLSVVRWFCGWLAARGWLSGTPSITQMAFITAGVLLAGLLPDLIGLHFIFGAFLLGAVMPKTIAPHLVQAFERFVMVALMPFYFMLSGLKTSFALTSGSAWLLFGCASLVAVSGKILGTALPEYFLQRSGARTALKSGILMQTKGLMELVVLNMLLTAGVISTTVFSALVLMAVVTTLLTKPALLLGGILLHRQPARFVAVSKPAQS